MHASAHSYAVPSYLTPELAEVIARFLRVAAKALGLDVEISSVLSHTAKTHRAADKKDGEFGDPTGPEQTRLTVVFTHKTPTHDAPSPEAAFVAVIEQVVAAAKGKSADDFKAALAEQQAELAKAKRGEGKLSLVAAQPTEAPAPAPTSPSAKKTRANP